MDIRKLKLILQARNITRFKLAYISGVSELTLTRLLNGKDTDPRISTVKAIAKALAVDINDII